jgi:DNA-binding NarL/FixJ family response regulator
MKGGNVLDKIMEINPEARVLLLSDFSQEERLHGFLKKGIKSFIIKPFIRNKLIEKIRETLN